MGQHGRGEYGKKKEIDSICLWPKRGESRRMLNTVATKCFKIKKKQNQSLLWMHLKK